jgi:hypothetical protein
LPTVWTQPMSCAAQNPIAEARAVQLALRGEATGNPELILQAAEQLAADKLPPERSWLECRLLRHDPARLVDPEVLADAKRLGLRPMLAALHAGADVPLAGLAICAELQGRHVCWWLGAMTCGGIIRCDDEGLRFDLPDDHAALLTEVGASNLEHLAQYNSMFTSRRHQRPLTSSPPLMPSTIRRAPTSCCSGSAAPFAMTACS